MWKYLPDDFLERAGDIFELVSTQNMIIETMQLVLMKIPPGWFPWEGRLNFPHESHSPAPSPCLSTILPRSSNLDKTFSFESGKEAESLGREETVARGCKTYMAFQLVWQITYSNLYGIPELPPNYLGLYVIGHLTGRHTAPHRTGQHLTGQ